MTSDEFAGAAGRPDELMQRSRLRWQCRRGMRELDVLLSAYLEHRYDKASAAEKAAFRRLLELSDPELAGYLLQGRIPAPDIAVVIEHILDRPES